MKLSLLDAVTAVALAAAIHRTDAAVVATAHRARELVARCNRPSMTRFINASDPFEGTWRVLEAIDESGTL